MSDIFGFSNYYYGSSGRDSINPQYNITEVHSSAAGLALANYGNMSDGQYVYLRNQANIESLCSAVASDQVQNVELCNNRFCLFNIIKDPCETTDLSSKNPDILQELLQKVISFNATVVPISDEMYIPDPRAHPKYWHNYWTPWLDKFPDTSGSSNLMPVNISLLLILTVIHFLFIKIKLY